MMEKDYQDKHWDNRSQDYKDGWKKGSDAESDWYGNKDTALSEAVKLFGEVYRGEVSAGADWLIGATLDAANKFHEWLREGPNGDNEED